jgi:PAS domain S-box-containing protein
MRDLQLHQRELEAQNRELVEAQALLEASRASYVELYDFAPVGYVTLDRGGVIRQINLAGAGLLEADRANIIGRPLRLFLPPESRPALDTHLRRCLAEPNRIVTDLLKKDGKGVLEITRGAVQSQATAAVLHMVVVDISDRTRADAERSELLARERKARERAETANLAREDFMAVISHELCTPLAPMMMWVEVLRRKSPSPSAELLNQALDALDACVSAQRNLVDDLFDLTRSRAGTQRIGREPVALAPIVSSVVNAMLPTADASKIAVRTIIDTASKHHIRGDAARLRQVVANLISNAIKFTPEGGLITVRLHQQGSRQILVVEDNGRGIDPAFLPHVFEPFRQQDSTPRRRRGGLGLGLCIARQLIAMHGGTLEVASQGRGHGARSIVTLPLSNDRAVASEQSGQGEDETPVALAPSPLAGLRLLLIEDERHTREAVAIALEHHGATILAVSSAEEGRAALETFGPDVVLCDIAMPLEDGHTFIRRLRKQERRGRTRLPALALTAHRGAEDRRKVMDSGFDMYVPKPVKTSDLVAAVLSLAKRGRRMANRPPGPAAPSAAGIQSIARMSGAALERAAIVRH